MSHVFPETHKLFQKSNVEKPVLQKVVEFQNHFVIKKGASASGNFSSQSSQAENDPTNGVERSSIVSACPTVTDGSGRHDWPPPKFFSAETKREDEELLEKPSVASLIAKFSSHSAISKLGLDSEVMKNSKDEIPVPQALCITVKTEVRTETGCRQIIVEPEERNTSEEVSQHLNISSISEESNASMETAISSPRTPKTFYPFNFKRRQSGISSPESSECGAGARCDQPSIVDTLFSKIATVSPFSGMSKAPKFNFLDETDVDTKSPMDRTYKRIKTFMRPGIGGKCSSAEDKFVEGERDVLDLCDQVSFIPMSNIFDPLRNIKKIGEGVFGEVYVATLMDNFERRVYKVVPIGGRQFVNGERQKTFKEISPEIRITQQLSKLHDGFNNCATDGYIQLHNIRLIKGQYHSRLLEAWKLFDDQNGSDNDCPVFPVNQIYMVFEFDHGGQDAESFLFMNAKQGLSLVLQVAHVLAVGESALEFEHRDLHWGNILIKRVDSGDRESIPYVIQGKELTTPSCGIEACIIDFTIARIVEDKTKSPIFLDLHDDEEQFLGAGDHQFDIYRMMRDFCRNQWGSFCPKSNIYWIHYLADKLLHKARYLEREGVEYRQCKSLLRRLQQDILRFDSCTTFVLDQHCEIFKNCLLKIEKNENVL